VAVPDSSRADRIFHNGRVHTLAAPRPGGVPGPTSALVAVAGRIVAVGGEELLALARPGTEVVDLQGAVVVPGFIETHMHPLLWGQLLANVFVGASACAGIDDIVDALRDRAAITPDGEPVRAWGFDDTLVFDDRELTRFDLDRASGSHPVMVLHVSGHSAYVNSLLLQQAGVTSASLDPPGGRVHRDADGVPTGALSEPPAMQAALALVGLQSGGRQTHETISEVFGELLRVGVTSVHDALVASDATLAHYATALRAGDRRVRVRGYLTPAALERAATSPLPDDDWLRVGGVKLISDGSIQLHTACLSMPYFDRPDDCGDMVIDPVSLTEQVGVAHRAGFQVAVHTNGDEAIDHALDAIEQAIASAPRRDHRHRLEHSQTVRDDQIARMQRLGVATSLFVNHVYYWGDRHRDRFLGPERAERIDPIRSVVNAGLRWALHSDCPVTPVNPLFTMAAAVNRRTSSGAVLGPEECVDAGTALAGYTTSAAGLSFDEADKGSLEVGKLADFVVLDGDLLACDPMTIPDIGVRMTVVGGAVAYEA
jgi:predicted amidohydrolase YtcJ